jgi:hypothetical protein
MAHVLIYTVVPRSTQKISSTSRQSGTDILDSDARSGSTVITTVRQMEARGNALKFAHTNEHLEKKRIHMSFIPSPTEPPLPAENKGFCAYYSLLSPLLVNGILEQLEAMLVLLSPVSRSCRG